VLEWRQSAANRKVQPAGSLQPTPPLWCTCPSRSWSQLCCLVVRGTCVWTTYPRLLRGMPRLGIELATFRSRVASANHWATAPQWMLCIFLWRELVNSRSELNSTRRSYCWQHGCGEKSKFDSPGAATALKTTNKFLKQATVLTVFKNSKRISITGRCFYTALYHYYVRTSRR